MKPAWILVPAICSSIGIAAAQIGPTPAGYWEGTAYNHEIPMKDHVRTLTRTVNAEFWFTVNWNAERKVGIVSGEAEAKYDSELKVENLPKVTVPAPGGNVKFEPSVGGKLAESDNQRRFPIVGVLRVDPNTGAGTLFLQKVNASTTQSQRTDVEAGGASAGYDTPMKFIMRADPGVSGTMSGLGGSGVTVSNSGTVSADSGMGASASANVGSGVGVIVKEIPMVPFSPFTSKPGRVSKRPGGPFTVSFEERSDKFNTKWTAKQVGGEQRDAAPITPDMQRQLDELMRRVEQLERGRR